MTLQHIQEAQLRRLPSHRQNLIRLYFLAYWKYYFVVVAWVVGTWIAVRF